MDPPRSVWQINGARELSTKGPVGPPAMAVEMHCPPVAATSVA